MESPDLDVFSRLNPIEMNGQEALNKKYRAFGREKGKSPGTGNSKKIQDLIHANSEGLNTPSFLNQKKKNDCSTNKTNEAYFMETLGK
jgi:hypothetical protein